MNRTYEFMHRTQEASSADELTAIAGEHFKEMGFEKFAYVILDFPQDRSFNKSYVSNYPVEWQDRYKASDYFSLDPVHKIARKRKTPFVWGDEEDIVPTTVKQKQFFQESGDIGTSEGISVPVLLSKGGLCLLSLCSGSMNKKAVQRYLHHIENELTALAFILHENAIALQDRPQITANYQLSDAERETLYWICQNKTYDNIGLILGLSREGVSERLSKIYRKMNAIGKIDAVKKAIESGLFQLQ